MNKYIAFYNGKEIEVTAPTSYNAQLTAQKTLKVTDNQRYKITVMLAEKDGETVTHAPLF